MFAKLVSLASACVYFSIAIVPAHSIQITERRQEIIDELGPQMKTAFEPFLTLPDVATSDSFTPIINEIKELCERMKNSDYHLHIIPMVFLNGNNVDNSHLDFNKENYPNLFKLNDDHLHELGRCFFVYSDSMIQEKVLAEATPRIEQEVKEKILKRVREDAENKAKKDLFGK